MLLLRALLFVLDLLMTRYIPDIVNIILEVVIIAHIL